MKESFPSKPNIVNLEEIRIKRENEEIIKNTQDKENGARIFLQHSPELLPPFIQVNQKILDSPGLSMDEKKLLRIYLYDIVKNVFDTPSHKRASAEMDKTRKLFLSTERTSACHETFTGIENIATFYLEHRHGQDYSLNNTPGEVVSLDGQKIPSPEYLSTSELLEKRANVILNEIQELYRHVEKSSVNSSEVNNLATVGEINNHVAQMVARLEQIEVSMKTDAQESFDSFQERFLESRQTLLKIADFLISKYE